MTRRVHLLASTDGLSFRVEQVRAGYPGAEVWVREEELTRLRDALEWYADEVMAYSITQPNEPRSAVHADRGERARAALAALPPPPGGDDEGEGAG